ncbi:MAG TPA: ABC transporter permease [Actinomycetota bacterium]|jgi:ABC-2 type transport system permease protein
MSRGSLALRQVAYTNKSFWRNPASAGFTFAFPLMFLVIFTALFGNSTVPVFGKQISTSTFYVAAISAFSIITATYTNLAISVAILRDGGALKRTRGSPLPAWAYLFGRVTHAVLVAFLLVVIVAVFGAVFYKAEIPTRTLPAFVATVALGAASFSALGLAFTAAIPNADAAPAVVNFSILPLLFLSDIFIPIQNPNAWYVTVAKVFPVYHFSQAMKAAYFSPTGNGIRRGDLLVIAVWGIAGVLAAAKFFSWEPRR